MEEVEVANRKTRGKKTRRLRNLRGGQLTELTGQINVPQLTQNLFKNLMN